MRASLLPYIATEHTNWWKLSRLTRAVNEGVDEDDDKEKDDLDVGQ